MEACNIPPCQIKKYKAILILINNSFTCLPSTEDLDKPLSNSAWSFFNSEIKITRVWILSFCGNCTKPSYFLAFSKLQRVRDKEGCTMDLHSGMVSVYLLLYLFIFLFLTLASSTLLATKYGGGFNAISSQCFLKSVLPECSFEVRCPHLFKFLNFQCLHTTRFCSCSSYLFLCGLLSHEII